MSIKLESLAGEHELTGVDYIASEELKSNYEWSGPYNGQVIRFVLDGKTYTAREDDNDGYRSAMEDLVEGGVCKNQFAPQRVLCSIRTEGEYGSKDDVLEMRDIATGKLVLEVGTDNTDDYYPSFVANFKPENMACNQTSV
jgi:hypothetical protein